MTAIDAARRIIELDKEATPGPWYPVLGRANDGTQLKSCFDQAEWPQEHYTVSPKNGAQGWETDCSHAGYTIGKDNAGFIAETRTLAPEVAKALLEAVELLKEAYPGMLEDPYMHPAELIKKIDKFLEGVK
jgi:hypothetical protein